MREKHIEPVAGNVVQKGESRERIECGSYPKVCGKSYPDRTLAEIAGAVSGIETLSIRINRTRRFYRCRFGRDEGLGDIPEPAEEVQEDPFCGAVSYSPPNQVNSRNSRR